MNLNLFWIKKGNTNRSWCSLWCISSACCRVRRRFNWFRATLLPGRPVYFEVNQPRSCFDPRPIFSKLQNIVNFNQCRIHPNNKVGLRSIPLPPFSTSSVTRCFLSLALAKQAERSPLHAKSIRQGLRRVRTSQQKKAAGAFGQITYQKWCKKLFLQLNSFDHLCSTFFCSLPDLQRWSGDSVLPHHQLNLGVKGPLQLHHCQKMASFGIYPFELWFKIIQMMKKWFNLHLNDGNRFISVDDSKWGQNGIWTEG